MRLGFNAQWESSVHHFKSCTAASKQSKRVFTSQRDGGHFHVLFCMTHWLHPIQTNLLKTTMTKYFEDMINGNHMRGGIKEKWRRIKVGHGDQDRIFCMQTGILFCVVRKSTFFSLAFGDVLPLRSPIAVLFLENSTTQPNVFSCT